MKLTANIIARVIGRSGEMFKYIIVALICCFGWSANAQTPGFARLKAGHHVKHHHRHRHHVRSVPSPIHELSHASGGIVTVPTAAGIPITVAAGLAHRFAGFIADLVANGYKPSHIGCYASGGHVPNSRHYSGAACDIDQRGWGKTAAPMYHVAALAAKHGLRDGCSFGDCGHLDDGQSLRRYVHRRFRRSYG